MGYLIEVLELFIHKVAYTKYDATVLVLWFNYITPHILNVRTRWR
jgi:hypothetical protein